MYIHKNDSYIDILDELDSVFFSSSSFAKINSYMLGLFAKKKRLEYWFKSGKYVLDPSSSINDVVNQLRSRTQDPVSVTFNSMDNIDELFSVVSSYLEFDSLDLVDYVNSAPVSKDSLYLRLIPNTYELYWSTSPQEFLKRMSLEYDKFWSEENINYAKINNLTKDEVFVLASIVDKESSHVDEMSTIAGLYLNRLQKNWKLAADPTIIYIMRRDYNEDIRRVRNKHINKTKSSPYNTYHNIGLPPFPICVPSLHAINAVLSPENHEYMFMCAKPDNSEYHNFAVSHFEHTKNAKAFHQWLNNRKIY